MDILTKSQKFVVADSAEGLVAYGMQHRRFYWVIEGQSGILSHPVVTSKMMYLPDYLDDSTIPDWVKVEYIKIQDAGYTCNQVIIGHELDTAPPAKPKISPYIKAAAIGVAGVVVAATLASVVIAGVGLAAAGTAAAGAVAIADPQFIIVTADNRWTCIASWLTKHE